MKLCSLLKFLLLSSSLSLFLAEDVAAQAGQKPSTLVQPALDSLAHAGSSIDLNRWKGSNGIREEVDANLASMQKDLQTTLPPLLTTADGSPDSASASLPVLLNLDALYSVLLRVTIASRNGAPREENTALEQAALLLDSARRDLGEAIMAQTKAQDDRIAELQAKAKQQASELDAEEQTKAAQQAQPVPKISKKRRTIPKPAAAPSTPQ